jgi:hypothetical protein
VKLVGCRRHFRQSAGSLPPAPSGSDIDRLVEEAMKAALAGEVRDDINFGEYASLFGFFRSAVMQEGRLLEMAIEQAVRKNPDLNLLPTKPMPIVPAAQEMLRRSRASRLPTRPSVKQTRRTWFGTMRAAGFPVCASADKLAGFDTPRGLPECDAERA